MQLPVFFLPNSFTDLGFGFEDYNGNADGIT